MAGFTSNQAGILEKVRFEPDYLISVYVKIMDSCYFVKKSVTFSFLKLEGNAGRAGGSTCYSSSWCTHWSKLFKYITYRN